MPAKKRRFTSEIIAKLDAEKYLYIRAGEEHRFIAIWVVVAGGRAFVRAYYLRAAGWYAAFADDPRGEIKLGGKLGRAIKIRGVPARGEKIRDAVDAAYLAKYDSASNLKYSKTFATKARRDRTLELLPR